MDVLKEFLKIGEYGAAGMYEEPDRSLFYRKALGLRRYYENCSLYKYSGEYLYPSGSKEPGMIVCPHISSSMWIQYHLVDDNLKEAAEMFVSEFHAYKSSVPKEHTVGGNMFTHSMPNYERILKEGFLSYIPRILKIEDADIRDGLIHVVEGIDAYVRRCVNYLKSVGADKKLTDALSKVPMKPAETIFEAIVAWNFIMYLDSCDNLGCLASGLYPYYKGENVVPYLENLYDNIEANNGYSMALHTDYNPLTLQCLEASKNRCRPMIELFTDENTPDEIWQKALEVVRSGNGQPAFYNPALLCALKEKIPVIRPEDISKFCGGGCTESMFAGLSNVGSLDAGINLLLILEEVIYSKLESSLSFDEFYGYFINELYDVADEVTQAICKSQKDRSRLNPHPMRTLLIDDCIDNGLDFNNGGARYQWSIVNFAGMINVIDSMLVIRDFVFEKKLMSAKELCMCLESNDACFLQKAKKHNSSFGNDNAEVNLFASRLSNDVFSCLDGKKPYFGECFLPASIQFNSQAAAGSAIGATPDGRKSGEPLCDSLAAIFEKDTKGPTSLLNSVTSLRLDKALGTPVVNFNINPGFDDEVLRSLVLGYMNRGGVQLQITCVSKEILKEAYENPDSHQNLIVRVGGYSDYFQRLDDKMKKMIIDRSVHL